MKQNYNKVGHTMGGGIFISSSIQFNTVLENDLKYSEGTQCNVPCATIGTSKGFAVRTSKDTMLVLASFGSMATK